MEFLMRLYNKLGKILNIPNYKQRPIYNINLDITKIQKRVAFVYSNSDFYEPYYPKEVSHSNCLSVYSKLKYFIDHDYVIDLYECNQSAPVEIANKEYDVVFGFGKLYSEICKRNPFSIKILYITENAPWVVEEKFKERLIYYKERHGTPKNAIIRQGYYTREMFELSDVGIAGNGGYNIRGMLSVLPKIYSINIPAIFNDDFKLNKYNRHNLTKKNFVWFGSSGAIHKGLDILIDVFRNLPDFNLDIYGAVPSEMIDFNLPKNVVNRGFINVKSEDFINQVVNKNSFVVSLSCSEAMQSSISTCMAHGLIPIITRETGFDDVPGAILCKDFHIENVYKVITQSSELSDMELKWLESHIFEYARKKFSIQYVNNQFYSIMDKIFNNEDFNNNDML